MKKYFIFAVAALAASVACTKTNIDTDQLPDQKITFDVVKYVPQTRADNSSLRAEGYEKFTTYAWAHNGSESDGQPYMNKEVVEYNSTDKVWAPTSHVYYWPKNSYINFFSYAGVAHTPDFTVSENSMKLEDAVIAADDNILVADASYGYSANASGTYGFDDVTQGVPVLFHHMLAKVIVNVKVDATDITDTKYNWKVDIDKANVTLSYRDKGTLEVAFTPETTAQTKSWDTATWTVADIANINCPSDKLNTISVNADGGSESAPATLVSETVVLPQTLADTGVTIAFTYTLTSTYDGGSTITEVVPVTATALSTTSVPAWAMNTIYTYTIVIKPNAAPVLFDPAVSPWTDGATTTVTID